MLRKIAIATLIVVLIIILWHFPFILLYTAYFVLGIVLLALFLLCLPIKGELWYNSRETFTFNLRFLNFIKFDIFPKKKKSKERPKTKKAKVEKEKAEKVLKKRKATVEEVISTFINMSSTLGKYTKRLLKKIIFKEFDFVYGVGGSDAASIAENYGAACPVVLSVANLFYELCDVKYRTIDIFPDFADDKGGNRIYVHFKVKVYPIVIIWVLIVFFFKLLPHFNTKSPKKKGKKGDQNGK